MTMHQPEQASETRRLAGARSQAHVAPLTTLADKVRPEHTAIVVIDVQNDFCAPGGMADREGLDLAAAQAMGDRVPDLLAAARASGAFVVFVRNVYTTPSNTYLSDVWLEQHARMRTGGSYTTVPVCERDAWSGDFYGDVRPQPEDAIVTKHRYAGFHQTDLELILRSHGIRTVVLTGIVTNVCVETTAREAFVRDFYVVVASDGCAAYSQTDHEQSLSNIRRFFGDVATIDEIVGHWESEREPVAVAAASAS